MSAFVLIPGAGGSAWYWHRVVDLLTAEGHTAVAVDLPGEDESAGLQHYADLVLAAIADYPAEREIVLVAQSLGGFTVPLVAEHTRPAGVVLVNAMVPAPGETAGDWWANTGAERARVARAARDHYDAEFDQQTYFLHDVPPELIAAGEPHQRAEGAAAFSVDCRFEGWPERGVRCVAGADDRFFPVEFQRRICRERLGIELDVLPGGHLIALSQPQALTDYLLER